MKGDKRISVEEDPPVKDSISADFVIIDGDLFPADDKMMSELEDNGLPEGFDEDLLYETYRDEKIGRLENHFSE